MAQPPIQSFQISPGTGTSFPVSPSVGNQFLLTADIASGSPLVATYLAGNYVWDGAEWISRPSSSASNWGWNDLRGHIDVNTAVPGTAPDWEIVRDNVFAWAFAPASLEQAYVSFHFNHDYVPGTDIYPHLHWTHNDASPGSTSVRWVMEYTIARGYEFEAFPATTTITLDDAVAGQYIHHIREGTPNETGGSPPISTIIDGTNIEADTMVLMRIYRDGAATEDDFASDAFLLEVDLHYQSYVQSVTPERNRPFTIFP